MKYTVFADGGLQALVNQTKANKTVAADNTAALDGLSTDFENMSGQITEVLGEVETCLNELETVKADKADITTVNEELSKKADTVTTTGSGNAITAISQSGNIITATKGKTFSEDGHGHPASKITGLSTVATSGKYSDLIGTPTSLPNAGALTFTGAVNATYDGSSAVSVEIPEALIGSTAEITPTQVANALAEGRPVYITHTDSDLGVLEANCFIVDDTRNVVFSSSVAAFRNDYIAAQVCGVISTGNWSVNIAILAEKTDIPTTLPNPNAITFTGAVTGTYDGSSAKTVNIPVAPVSSVNGKTGTVSLSASDVGADESGAANTALTNAKSYTDTKISDLINSAPTTLDTLGEIATAMENNADVVEALEDAIGTKATASDLTAHTGNTSNPHGVTKSQVGLGSVVNTGDSATPVSGGTTKFTTGGAYTELNKKVDKTTTVNGHALSGNVTVTKSDVGLGNVENKSSATIRGELTKENVTDALGYTPPTSDTTYSAAGSSLGLVKSGGDVTISSGVITVNDDSHNHTIANVDGLQSALDGKAAKSEGAFYIEGTGTTDSEAKTSTWTGTSDRITEYYDGLTIRYKIGVAGQSTVTLNINGLGAKTVYRFSTSKLTTHFPVGSIIHLIYHADLNDGCWVTNDYDANTNTYQRVYASTTNVEYPITARYNTTTGSTYYAEYGRYSTGVTLNPSTNTITATKFKGALTGNADTATKWATARTITLSGDASGSVSLDGSADKTLTVTVADNSHAHTIANITNLQSTIDSLTARIAALEAAIGFVATEADM